MRPARAIALAVLRVYQILSPALPRGHCRHWPTCSDYARQAIERHGAWRGTRLALARLGRCHPLGTAGYDPVP